MNNIENKYNRIIVKAGTRLLTGGSGQLDLTILENLVSQIAELQRSGQQIVLVSSGAVAVGRSAVDSVLENMSEKELAELIYKALYSGGKY